MMNIESIKSFMIDCFYLLNGLVNPSTLVWIMIFTKFPGNNPCPVARLASTKTCGKIILVDPNRVQQYLLSYNVKDWYTCMVDIIAHELVHTTQEIDYARYHSDDEYRLTVEEDCSLKSARFIYNYKEWLSEHLGVPITIYQWNTYYSDIQKLKDSQIKNMMDNPIVL